MAKIEEGMEVCDSCEVHENLLKIVNEKMPEETELYDLAELFKVFGDSTRMRILFVLFEAEVCVCDLAEALNMTQSAISHQLRILKQNKLVKSRREGKSVVLFTGRRSCAYNCGSRKRTYRRRFILKRRKLYQTIKSLIRFFYISNIQEKLLEL